MGDVWDVLYGWRAVPLLESCLWALKHLRFTRQTSAEAAVGERKFDGVGPGGMLIDAKGPGYANFVGKDGRFTDWFLFSKSGGLDLLARAQKRIDAAPQGTAIVCAFAEQRAQQATITLLRENGYEGINVIYSPPGTGRLW